MLLITFLFLSTALVCRNSFGVARVTATAELGFHYHEEAGDQIFTSKNPDDFEPMNRLAGKLANPCYLNLVSGLDELKRDPVFLKSVSQTLRISVVQISGQLIYNDIPRRPGGEAWIGVHDPDQNWDVAIPLDFGSDKKSCQVNSAVKKKLLSAISKASPKILQQLRQAQQGLAGLGFPEVVEIDRNPRVSDRRTQKTRSQKTLGTTPASQPRGASAQ